MEGIAQNQVFRDPLSTMTVDWDIVEVVKIGGSKAISLPSKFCSRHKIGHTEEARYKEVSCMMIKGIEGIKELSKFTSKEDEGVEIFSDTVKIAGRWRVKEPNLRGNRMRYCYRVILPENVKDKFEVGEKVFCIFSIESPGKFFAIFDYNRTIKQGSGDES